MASEDVTYQQDEAARPPNGDEESPLPAPALPPANEREQPPPAGSAPPQGQPPLQEAAEATSPRGDAESSARAAVRNVEGRRPSRGSGRQRTTPYPARRPLPPTPRGGRGGARRRGRRGSARTTVNYTVLGLAEFSAIMEWMGYNIEIHYPRQ